MADDEVPLDPAAISRLRRLGGEDLVGRMVSIFLKNAPERLRRATAAAAAADAAGVERATHSLKSMAANIGALQLYAMSESIEVDAAAGSPGHLAERVRRLAAELDVVCAALQDLMEEET